MKLIGGILVCILGIITLFSVINFFGLAQLSNTINTEDYSEGE